MSAPFYNIIPLHFEPPVRPANDNGVHHVILGERVTFSYADEKRLYAGRVVTINYMDTETCYGIRCTDGKVRFLYVPVC